MDIYLVGHGGLNRSVDAGFPETTFVPTGTTLQFYSEAGQTVSLMGLRGVEALLDGEVTPALDPIHQGGGTYNFALTALTNADDVDADAIRALRAKHPKATLRILTSGDSPEYLCKGNSQTCQRSTGIHTCGGLLATYATHTLHWIACTYIKPSDEEAAMALAAGRDYSPDDVVFGNNPDSWDHALAGRGGTADEEGIVWQSAGTGASRNVNRNAVDPLTERQRELLTTFEKYLRHQKSKNPQLSDIYETLSAKARQQLDAYREAALLDATQTAAAASSSSPQLPPLHGVPLPPPPDQ